MSEVGPRNRQIRRLKSVGLYNDFQKLGVGEKKGKMFKEFEESARGFGVAVDHIRSGILEACVKHPSCHQA